MGDVELTFRDCFDGFLIIVIIVLGILAGHWKPPSDPNDEKLKYSLLGTIEVKKLSDKTYKVHYDSFIDKVSTEAVVNGTFELGQVKTLVDAAVNKKFYKIKVQKQCLIKLIQDTKEINFNIPLTCNAYGDYGTALEVYDRDLWVDDLIQIEYIEENMYANLIKR